MLPARTGCNRGGSTLAGAAWANLRATAGQSIREWESATGINRGDLSKIERGVACPTPHQAQQILDAFDAIAVHVPVKS